MRIVVPINQDGGFSRHFGQSNFAEVYEARDGRIVGEPVRLAFPAGGGCHAIPAALAAHGVHCVIVGGIGASPLARLHVARIDVRSTPADAAPRQLVEQFLAGSLVEGANPCADHDHLRHAHGHGQHGHGHGQGHRHRHGCCHT